MPFPETILIEHNLDASRPEVFRLRRRGDLWVKKSSLLDRLPRRGYLSVEKYVEDGPFAP